MVSNAHFGALRIKKGDQCPAAGLHLHAATGLRLEIFVGLPAGRSFPQQQDPSSIVYAPNDQFPLGFSRAREFIAGIQMTRHGRLRDLVHVLFTQHQQLFRCLSSIGDDQ